MKSDNMDFTWVIRLSTIPYDPFPFSQASFALFFWRATLLSIQTPQVDGGTCQEIMDSRPSLPVAELRGHGDGPIHIIRFTGEDIVS